MKIGPKIDTIVLDVDDVLNKFVPFISKEIFGVGDGESLDWFSPIYGWDLVGAVSHALGLEVPMSPTEFWEKIPSELWRQVPKSDECEELVETAFRLVGEDHVFLATSPTLDHFSLPFKVRWIEEQLPKSFHRRWSVTPIKRYFGTPGALLIDDRESNCNDFRLRPNGAPGGDSILWPKAWNSAGHWYDKMTYLKDHLRVRRFTNDVHL